MADDTYTVERSTTIDAPPERIYQHVANFRSWRSWSPWEGVDPDMRRTYSGPDTGPGATYAWEGNRKAGAGRMEIVEAAEPARVRIDLRFLKPFKARNETVFTIRPEGSGSHLTWTMTGRKTLADEDHGDLQVHGRDDRARLRERAGFPEVDRGAVDDALRPLRGVADVRRDRRPPTPAGTERRMPRPEARDRKGWIANIYPLRRLADVSALSPRHRASRRTAAELSVPAATVARAGVTRPW